jgi:ariadne-1
MIRAFQDVTTAPPHVAVGVLRACKYDLELSKSRWFEDSAALMRRAHVVMGPDPPPRPADWGDSAMCELCYSDVTPEEMDALPCGHWFCLNCWKEYVHAHSKEKAALLSLSCMAECDHSMTDRLLGRCLEDSAEDLSRWKRWVAEEFASDDLATRSCPTDGCEFVCRYPKGVARDVICPNGHIFCFSCGQEGHAPATCRDARRWRKALSSDSMDIKLILSKCRPCPKCGVMIEKNQGCKFPCVARDWRFFRP